MTLREKLIEKVAVVIRTQSNLPHAGFADCHEYLKDSQMIAEAIIDFLKLEVVDNDIIHGLEYCVPETPIININNLGEV